MKLVAGIYNLKQLNKFIEFLDCAILYSNYSQISYSLDIDKAIELCNAHAVTPIIGMNKIIYPMDEKNFKEYMEKYIAYNCLFYVSDIGGLSIAKDLGIENRVIFDPETMITNYLDAQLYFEFGANAIGISSEIPVADVKEICLKTNVKIFYQIFGSRQMMKSRRHLISLYSEKINSKCNKEGILRESTRDDYFPIIENENGTFIFRSGLISLLDCYNDIKDIEYGYIESLNIDDSILAKALEIYYKLNKNLIDLEAAINLLNSLKLDLKEGFKFKDSVYQKEEF